jgi:uncharacterized protein
VAQTVAESALAAVEEMIFKEERILLPMSLQHLTETEWGEIFTQSPQFGYCLVDPLDGYAPAPASSDVPEAAMEEAARRGIAFAPSPRRPEAPGCCRSCLPRPRGRPTRRPRQR